MKNILISGATPAATLTTDDTDFASLALGDLGLLWARKTQNATAGASDTAVGGGNAVAATDIVSKDDQIQFVVGKGSTKANIGLPLTLRDLSYSVKRYSAEFDKTAGFKITMGTITTGNDTGVIIIDQSKNVNERSASKEFTTVFKTSSTATLQAIKDQIVAFYGAARVTGASDATTITLEFLDHSNYKVVLNVNVTQKGTSVIKYPVTSGYTFDAEAANAATVGTADTIKKLTGSDVWYRYAATDTATAIGFGSAGKGSDIVKLEKEIAVLKGYNPSSMALGANAYSEAFLASASLGYNIITIKSKNNRIGSIVPVDGMIVEQILCIAATTNGNTLTTLIANRLAEMAAGTTLSAS